MRKVNELVREVVADAVQDLKDPRIGFVTITGAETSPDLRHAVVYYSALGDEQEKADSAAALASGRSRIQAALGAQTRLRYTPKLTFRVDPSIDQGLRISEILTELASGEDGARTGAEDVSDDLDGAGEESDGVR
jgi:ribosome-binding factor A